MSASKHSSRVQLCWPPSANLDGGNGTQAWFREQCWRTHQQANRASSTSGLICLHNSTVDRIVSQLRQTSSWKCTPDYPPAQNLCVLFGSLCWPQLLLQLLAELRDTQLLHRLKGLKPVNCAPASQKGLNSKRGLNLVYRAMKKGDLATIPCKDEPKPGQVLLDGTCLHLVAVRLYLSLPRCLILVCLLAKGLCFLDLLASLSARHWHEVLGLQPDVCLRSTKGSTLASSERCCERTSLQQRKREREQAVLRYNLSRGAGLRYCSSPFGGVAG